MLAQGLCHSPFTVIPTKTLQHFIQKQPGSRHNGNTAKEEITEFQHKEQVIARKEQNKHAVLPQESPEENAPPNFTGQLHCHFTHSPQYKSIMLCYKIPHSQLMLLSSQGLILVKDLFDFLQLVSKFICSLSVSMLLQPELYYRPLPGNYSPSSRE